MNIEGLGFFFIFIILGIFNIILGFLIKKYKMSEIIPFFNIKKHKPKTVCKIVGDSITLLGLLNVLYSCIYYFLNNNNPNCSIVFIIFNVCSFIALIINIIGRWDKFGLKKDSTV